MAKITFDYKDNSYTLEFDRDSVRKTEQMGLRINEIGNMPATMFPILFEGAFIKHHRRVPKKTIDEIFNSMSDAQDLLGEMVNMYMDALNSMLDDDDESKNVKWTLS